MKKSILLDRGWTFVRQADSAEQAGRLAGEPVSLPHTWNAADGQDGGNDYYRGQCWYCRHLDMPDLEPGGRAVLELEGAALTTEVYLNGQKLATNSCGFSAFRVDLTPALAQDNLLVISVDNRENPAVYPQKADFTFYGGIYRPVRLITVPQTHFALAADGAPALRVTPEVNPAAHTARVTVEAAVEGPARTVRFTVGGQEKLAAVMDGHAKAVFDLADVRLWDGLQDPYLYTAVAELDDDRAQIRFGCRSFTMDPQQGFLLNGRPYPLRGVSRHQDRAGVGNALTDEMQAEDMAFLREIGANTVRLAHYQHAQTFYDLCDENGIIVWAEIPYITMHRKEGRANTLAQMQALVTQNRHHPSIVCWGLSNEITAASAVDEDLLENHRALNDLCHRLDPTRPTTMANVFMLETDSPILEIPDINSYNLYFGWYLGELEQNDEFFDAYHARYPDRCIGLSEYGADANPALQAAEPQRGDYSEGYQCLYHEHMLEMIEARPWLWATHVWNLFDFAADGREEGGKSGVNQKGLVTMDRKTRKDAFYLYKAHWSKEPFVHLCGRRYIDRAEATTEIKVYSNQPQVTLLVDGQVFQTQSSRFVFRFRVPLQGEHRIEALAGELRDSIRVRRVDQPNAAYQLNGSNSIVNWFDQEDLSADRYSVMDTMGTLRANPKTGAIIEQMMAKMMASRGDVADAVHDNPGLQKMLARMTLLSLLKQGGADAESVRQLNRILQGIPKE